MDLIHDRLFTAECDGYAPSGEIRLGNVPTDAGEHPILLEFARAAELCNDAALRRSDDGWHVEGDPMEGALLTLSRKIAGNDGAAPFGEFDRADAIPFDAAYRYMAVLHRASDGGAIVHVKGAPEAVLAMCNDQRAPSKRPAARLPPQRRDSWGAP